MIQPYDEIMESIKTCQNLSKSKPFLQQIKQNHSSISSIIDMRVLWFKQKEQQAIKYKQNYQIVTARKLKIKIMSLLNVHSHNITHPTQAISLKPNKAEQAQLSINCLSNLHEGSSKRITKKRSSSMKRIKGHEKESGNLKQNESGNIFGKLSDQELYKIEQDEQYYLANEKNVYLFRKYMMTKRRNLKDASYEQFQAKFQLSKDNYQFLNPEQPNYVHPMQFIRSHKDIKGLIASQTKLPRQQTQVLINFQTNPTFPSERGQFHQNRSEFKRSFTMKRQFIIRTQGQRVKKLKNYQVYSLGIAYQNKCIQDDLKKQKIINFKQSNDVKTKIVRKKIKSLQNYGQIVKSAQLLRSKCLKSMK